MPVAKKKAPAKNKKATAKKAPATKAKAPAKKNGKLMEAAREILPRLKKGQTTLGAERDKLGLSGNGPLRKALTELLGSKKAYSDMMAAARKTKAA